VTPSRRALCLALAAALCLSVQAARADAQESADYYVRSIDGRARIVQRLSWPGDENASRYEVVVEREEETRFTEIHREKTERTFVELSLGPGNYRYRVLVYNLLFQFEYDTNWARFNIILAVQPELARFSPDCFYLYEENEWRLTLRGRNLVEGAELFLVPIDGPEGTPREPGGVPIASRSYTPDARGETAAALFDGRDLRPGFYRILLKNPGGLETSLEPFRIARVWDFAVEAGYAPLFPVYGFLADFFDRPQPAGAYLRAVWFPLRRDWRNLGIGAVFSWNYLKAEKTYADLSAHAAAVRLDLTYRIWLIDEKAALDIEAGGGLEYLAGLTVDFGRRKKTLSVMIPTLDAGVFFQWYLYRTFNLEIGLHYGHFLTPDHPQPGFIRPSFGLGGQF
jgi:hypothetical protein